MSSEIWKVSSEIIIDRGRQCAYNVGMRRKTDETRKEEMVRVRMTADQKALFMEAAQKVGLDLSGWLRFIALKEAKALLGEEMK